MLITFITLINSILKFQKYRHMDEAQYLQLQQETKIKVEKDIETAKQIRKLNSAIKFGRWLGGQF